MKNQLKGICASSKLIPLLILAMMVVLITPQAHAQGIRFGGEDTHGGLRQSEGRSQQGGAQRDSGQTQGQRLGGQSAPKKDGWNVVQEAEKLKARYRDKLAERSGTAHEHRYGFVVAFMDTASLMEPVMIKGLKRLESMDGIKFLLFNSKNTAMPHMSRSKMKRLEKLDPPMARDDTGGQVAGQYNVDKFPTVLYETPEHDVLTFYVPNTLEKVFTRINREVRKQSRR